MKGWNPATQLLKEGLAVYILLFSGPIIIQHGFPPHICQPKELAL
jgi:hypothetical protein